ncbi:hypothetical protein BTJ40_13915 [Microbulbifer sp. A4B17]|nr:hypothetical protein BTJ40_13915 [Microbulbifer sp. A4B17]
MCTFLIFIAPNIAVQFVASMVLRSSLIDGLFSLLEVGGIYLLGGRILIGDKSIKNRVGCSVFARLVKLIRLGFKGLGIVENNNPHKFCGDY